MIDLAQHLAAVHRAVERRADSGTELVHVRMQRTYNAAIDDVWSAVTEPDRIRRWFLPLTGDLRVGGSFQLEGNAGGDILSCEAPTLLRVTFGGPTSVVELRLTEASEQTILELDHMVPIELAGSGAGALYAGPGWDGALLGLGLYLDGEIAPDPVAAASSKEAQEFSLGAIGAWVVVIRESGTAGDDAIAAAQQVSIAQFAPDLIGQPTGH